MGLVCEGAGGNGWGLWGIIKGVDVDGVEVKGVYLPSIFIWYFSFQFCLFLSFNDCPLNVIKMLFLPT